MNNLKTIKQVLDFWYDQDNATKWFKSTPDFDASIKKQFETTWDLASQNKLDSWKETAEGNLALCIVLDQFPLNMFRGENKSFQTESLAIEVAKNAIKKHHDDQIDSARVSFMYLPLMHSEDLDDQNTCVTCFENRNLEDNVRFAKHHRGIIEEFGRFPHRNEILGRESTAEEIAYLDSDRAFKG